LDLIYIIYPLDTIYVIYPLDTIYVIYPLDTIYIIHPLDSIGKEYTSKWIEHVTPAAAVFSESTGRRKNKRKSLVAPFVRYANKKRADQQLQEPIALEIVKARAHLDFHFLDKAITKWKCPKLTNYLVWRHSLLIAHSINSTFY
jgi:hypothetical protein